MKKNMKKTKPTKKKKSKPAHSHHDHDHNHDHDHSHDAEANEALTIEQIILEISDRIPSGAAESWDPVGLICGDKSSEFKGMVVGVDLTENLLNLALKTGSNMIVIHHPPLFPKGRGITRLIHGSSNDLTTLLLKAFQKNICVYVAHTNFDRCALDGMIQLARDLGGNPVGRLWESAGQGKTLLKKLVTTIPIDHFDEVKNGLYDIGCGHIGHYDSCGFGIAGQGNFRALPGATPVVGKKAKGTEPGPLETVEEIRFETLVPAGLEEIVVKTLKDLHPYEEVAYDLYAVEQEPTSLGLVWGLGYGFVAELKTPVSYQKFCTTVKKVFRTDHFVTNQHEPKLVKRIAFTPGKGNAFLRSVRNEKADVYLTGEVGYHDSVSSARQGLNVIELGHRESELYFLMTWESWCQEWSIPHFILDERLQRII